MTVSACWTLKGNLTFYSGGPVGSSLSVSLVVDISLLFKQQSNTSLINAWSGARLDHQLTKANNLQALRSVKAKVRLM